MHKKRDLVLLIIWPILASLISFLINANFFVSTLLFLGVPSVYLSFINKKYIKKLLLFSLIFGIPLAFVIEYIMEFTKGWFIPYSIFGSVRLFDVIPVEAILWAILEIYFVLIFYETFLEEKCTPKLYHPYLKYMFIAALLALGIFILLYFYNQSLLHINYFYLKVGIVLAVLPIFGVLFKFPNLLNKFLSIGAYFFFFNFIYEITAVKLGQWSFPAENQIIGIVDILGIRFAFEELLFWIILSAIAIVSFYEVFDDDQK